MNIKIKEAIGKAHVFNYQRRSTPMGMAEIDREGRSFDRS